MGKKELVVDETEKGTRLDVYLTGVLADLTRSQVQKLIEENVVLVNNRPVKANYKVKAEDVLVYQIPVTEPLQVLPENIPLDLLYEDKDLLVVNKPRGMVVHPARSNYKGTLVNALLYHCVNLSQLNGRLRPGIVHRIDKDTSGLLVVAKNDFTHQGLAEQLKGHKMKREYLALVYGEMPEPGGLIEAPIGRDLRDRQRMAVSLKNSKHAVTRYQVLERLSGYTLIKCCLETGRTHQIRVHMAYIGYPVVGDPKYGLRKAADLGFKGQALHAATLGFVHPRSREWLEFTEYPPEDFRHALQILESKLSVYEKGEEL
jgi:23S rRNA pseudouridine1911/1915/1917 synthase